MSKLPRENSKVKSSGKTPSFRPSCNGTRLKLGRHSLYKMLKQRHRFTEPITSRRSKNKLPIMPKPQCTPFSPEQFRTAFFAKVKVAESGCWEWTGAKNKDGYGNVMYQGRCRMTHRVSWRIHYGDIPPGDHVLHRCDNPACVRPDHLFLGNQDLNMKDCAAKGRIRFAGGKSSPFTASQIEFIRAVSEEGFSRSCIARYFGVARQSIDQIVNRETWAFV